MHRRTWLRLALTPVLLSLAAVIIFFGSGPDTLDSEITFDTALVNSLLNLDQAKERWAQDKNKAEHALPTMADLTPYLGTWTNTIKRFSELGINYKITPVDDDHSQSEVATLTRDLHFRSGFCHFYPAGTRYGPQIDWVSPKLTGRSAWRAYYFNNRLLFAGVFCVLAVANLLVFTIKTARLRKRQANTALQQ